jgi:hypothetical protein
MVSRNSNNYLLKNYRIYCSILKRVIREAKRTYYNNLLLLSDNKLKATWKIFQMETGTKKDSRECLTKNFENRDNKINLEEAALTFNKHFISIAENLNTNKASVNPAMSYMNKHFTEAFPIMNLLPITESEITSVINNLKLTYSSGYDDITNKVLKLSSQLISKPMTYVFNKSLYTGVYPERVKYAVINPVYKKGDKTCINNYRPVSLLTGFAKIFKSVIF